MALQEVDDATLLLCCELFIKTRGRGKSVEVVAKELNRKAKRKFNRIDVYRMIALAHERGFFKILPSAAHELEKELATAFELPDTLRDGVHVVPALEASASEAVSSFAADHALELIKELGRRRPKRRIGVGFVGGHTVMRVARFLAMRMRSDTELPAQLSFNSLCLGFEPRHPETAPLTFLGYFAEVMGDVTYGAFVGAPVVSRKDYKTIAKDPLVVKSAFLRDEVDVVVTSLADFSDKHNVLRDLAKITGDSPSTFTDAGVVGDVAYQPFDKHKPATVNPKRRALTLFSIPDLVKLAETPDKEVLLVGGPCPGCDTSRARSLEPLLRAPKLRVWSHVYMDSLTAQNLRSNLSD